ncbi:MAG: DUF1918 domain-containing protein [Micromonosporaceae bacterium]
MIVESRTLSDRRRDGLITEVLGSSGAPPYRVRWLDTGGEAFVIPGPDARVTSPEEHRSAAHKALHFAAHPEAESGR